MTADAWLLLGGAYTLGFAFGFVAGRSRGRIIEQRKATQWARAQVIAIDARAAQKAARR